MNRKQWFIGRVILVVIIILGALAWSRISDERSDDSEKGGWNVSVTELVYCGSNDIEPCIVSFSLDADNNMLVNLLLPDQSFPNFYLKVMRGEENVVYECKRIAPTPNNAYCSGDKLPPGEVLHLMLISSKDDSLLAEGNLSIVGLAFPTLEIVFPTASPANPSPTEPTDIILPTPTRIVFPTATKPPPSYPSPPYP